MDDKKLNFVQLDFYFESDASASVLSKCEKDFLFLRLSAPASYLGLALCGLLFSSTVSVLVTALPLLLDFLASLSAAFWSTLST